MACSGCEQRREAIRQVARNVGVATGTVFSALRNLAAQPKLGPDALPVVRPSTEDAGRRAVQPRNKMSAR